MVWRPLVGEVSSYRPTAAYAMSGTRIAYGGPNCFLRYVRHSHSVWWCHAISLPVCYALSVTHIVYGYRTSRMVVPYYRAARMLHTDLHSVWLYQPQSPCPYPTPCPVLR